MQKDDMAKEILVGGWLCAG